MESKEKYRQWILEQIQATDKRLMRLNNTKSFDLNILFGTIALVSISVSAGSVLASLLLGVMSMVAAVKYASSVLKFNEELGNYRAYMVNLQFEDMD